MPVMLLLILPAVPPLKKLLLQLSAASLKDISISLNLDLGRTSKEELADYLAKVLLDKNSLRHLLKKLQNQDLALAAQAMLVLSALLKAEKPLPIAQLYLACLWLLLNGSTASNSGSTADNIGFRPSQLFDNNHDPNINNKDALAEQVKIELDYHKELFAFSRFALKTCLSNLKSAGLVYELSKAVAAQAKVETRKLPLEKELFLIPNELKELLISFDFYEHIPNLKQHLLPAVQQTEASFITNEELSLIEDILTFCGLVKDILLRITKAGYIYRKPLRTNIYNYFSSSSWWNLPLIPFKEAWRFDLILDFCLSRGLIQIQNKILKPSEKIEIWVKASEAERFADLLKFFAEEYSHSIASSATTAEEIFSLEQLIWFLKNLGGITTASGSGWYDFKDLCDLFQLCLKEANIISEVDLHNKEQTDQAVTPQELCDSTASIIRETFQSYCYLLAISGILNLSLDSKGSILKLSISQTGNILFNALEPQAIADSQITKKSKTLTILPNFEVLVQPGTDLYVRYQLQKFSQLVSRHGGSTAGNSRTPFTMITPPAQKFFIYKITKESIYQAFLDGCKKDWIVKFLETEVVSPRAKSGETAIPQNLLYFLDDYWQQFHRIILFDVPVLMTDNADTAEELEGCIERALKPFILKRIFPNLFLLDKNNYHEALEFFRKEGFLPQPHFDSFTDPVHEGGNTTGIVAPQAINENSQPDFSSKISGSVSTTASGESTVSSATTASSISPLEWLNSLTLL